VNGWLIAAIAGGGWLAVARAWFGLLVWRGYFRWYVRRCAHNFHWFHKGQSCHPVSMARTRLLRGGVALLWPLMALPWLVYVTVTGGWRIRGGI